MLGDKEFRRFVKAVADIWVYIYLMGEFLFVPCVHKCALLKLSRRSSATHSTEYDPRLDVVSIV